MRIKSLNIRINKIVLIVYGLMLTKHTDGDKSLKMYD